MRTFKLFFIFWILMFSTPGMTGTSSATSAISISTLSSKPEAYNGSVITVEGKLSMEFEGTFLSIIRCEKILSEEATKNLWLVVPKKFLIEANKFNHKRVRITGKFDSKAKGHMGLFFGTLKVEKIEELNSEKNEC